MLLSLAACQRQTPLGAEAAWQAADRPKPVLAAATPQASPIPDAQAFVSQAGASDAFEIAAAQTAAQRAQNPDVRAFATVMIHDHTDSSAGLKAALAEAGQGLSPPAGPTADQQAKLDALRSADPKVFDKTYLDGQVQAHRTALAQLAAYAQNGQVVALSSFAANGAGMTQTHLAMAKSLDEQLP